MNTSISLVSRARPPKATSPNASFCSHGLVFLLVAYSYGTRAPKKGSHQDGRPGSACYRKKQLTGKVVCGGRAQPAAPTDTNFLSNATGNELASGRTGSWSWWSSLSRARPKTTRRYPQDQSISSGGSRRLAWLPPLLIHGSLSLFLEAGFARRLKNLPKDPSVVK